MDGGWRTEAGSRRRCVPTREGESKGDHAAQEGEDEGRGRQGTGGFQNRGRRRSRRRSGIDSEVARGQEGT
eukprot:3566844-Pyramimonas_sp.AAC.1